MNIYLFICIKYVIKFLRKLKCLFNYFLVFFLRFIGFNIFFLNENEGDENDDKYHNENDDKYHNDVIMMFMMMTKKMEIICL